MVGSGTVIAQVISVTLTPVVTRLYSPEDYGVLTSFNSIIAVLVIVGSLDYHKAIPLAKSDKQARDIIVLSVLILSLMSVLVLIVLMFVSDVSSSAAYVGEIDDFKFYVPLALFFIGLYKIFLELALRNRNYRLITQTSIYQSSFANSSRILLGVLDSGGVGLILSSIIGKSFGVKTLMKPFLFLDRFWIDLNLKNLRYVLHHFKRYPLYSTPSNLVYTLGNNIPMLVMLAIFGSFEVGLFGLANNIINIPLSFIGMSVSQVFFAEAAKIGKHEPLKLKNMSIELVKKLATIGLLPLFVVLIFGPQIFSFVFGIEWYEAGIYARVLSVMVYFHLLILPIGRLLEVLELQKLGLFFNVIRLVCIGLVFFLAINLDLSSINTIICYVIINSTFYLFLLMFVVNRLKNESLLSL